MRKPVPKCSLLRFSPGHNFFIQYASWIRSLNSSVHGRCNYPESDRGRIGRMFIDIVFRNCSAIISSLHGIQVFLLTYMQGPCGGTDVSPAANGTFGFINHQGPGTLAAMIRYWAFPQGALLRRSWSLGNLLYCYGLGFTRRVEWKPLRFRAARTCELKTSVTYGIRNMLSKRGLLACSCFPICLLGRSHLNERIPIAVATHFGRSLH